MKKTFKILLFAALLSGCSKAKTGTLIFETFLLSPEVEKDGQNFPVNTPIVLPAGKYEFCVKYGPFAQKQTVLIFSNIITKKSI